MYWVHVPISQGEHYTHVPGPHFVHPSPQRTPVIFQAGSSGPGMAFAGQNAEAVFIAAHKPQLGKKRVDAVREAARKADRAEDAIKVLALLTVIVEDTDEAAEEAYAGFQARASDEGALALFGGWTGIDLAPFGDEDDLLAPGSAAVAPSKSNAIQSAVEGFAKSAPEVGKWTKKSVAQQLGVGGLGPVVRGSPASVADQLEEWVNVAGVDGFNFAYAVTPGTQLALVDKLVPELQRRGHVWGEYPKPSEAGRAANGAAATSSGSGTSALASESLPGVAKAGSFGEGTHPALTAREHLYGVGQPHLRADHWASRLTWKAGEVAPPLTGHAPTSAESQKKRSLESETAQKADGGDATAAASAAAGGNDATKKAKISA